MIENKGDYRITIGDGSRTTKLTINKLDFSDAAEYECTGMTRNVMNSAVYVLEFLGTYLCLNIILTLKFFSFHFIEVYNKQVYNT